MLCYLGTGPRYYGDKPFSISQRHYWEFQAVLQGSFAMAHPSGPGLLHSRYLWLSAPGHPHGWTGLPGQSAEVAVFHFLSIPESIKQRFRRTQCLEMRLTTAQCARLKFLAAGLQQSWQLPSPEMLLRHEHLLLELSLLLSQGGDDAKPDSAASQRQRVQHALSWFNLHMHRNPSLDETGRAAGVSPAHLRRLFHEVMQSSPKQVFDQLRFQRALHLMADPVSKLAAISEECGFESPSAFSRAFKNKFGCSPQTWRGIQ